MSSYNAKSLGSTRLAVKRANHPPYREVKVRKTGRWMLEHRFIMQMLMGKPLKTNEHVHHIDGNTLNNRIENLQLLSAADHMILTHKGKGPIFWRTEKEHRCPVCGLIHRGEYA